jgi:hypothetical protein
VTPPKPLSNVGEHDQTARLEELESCMRVRMTLEEQYENWKKTSFLEKPMMRKEFEKYTEMSVEDMVCTLTKLEDSLQNQEEQITGFIEPLRRLGTYWRKAGSDLNVGSGHNRLNGAELLANMIVIDAQRMLFDNIATRC